MITDLVFIVWQWCRIEIKTKKTNIEDNPPALWIEGGKIVMGARCWQVGDRRWKKWTDVFKGESENDSKSLLNEEDDKSLAHSLLKYVALAK